MSYHRDEKQVDESPGVSAAGTPIGRRSQAEPPAAVCIPLHMHGGHVHIIGVAGVGKSTLMERMVLDDIRRGEGVLALDSHGVMTRRLLHLLPREAIERTIYFDFNDPDWLPSWNPLYCGSGVNRSLLVDRIVCGLVNGGHLCSARVEYLLRQVFFAVLHLPTATFLDAATLFRKRSADNHRLTSRILEVVHDDCAINFWKHEFSCYTETDLAIPRFLLSKLLMTENVGAMLSQRGSSINLRDVMDNGKILLVDLSAVGPETKGVLGGLMLSLLHMEVIGRANGPERIHRPFHLYCDEAHQSALDVLEDLFAEARRSAVNLVLSHRYMSQVYRHLKDSLSAVGSKVVFRINKKDAEYLAEDLQGKIPVDELITLEVGQAIARVGNQVLRLETFPPLAISQHHFRDEIIARCHERYYLPSDKTVRALR